MPTIEVSGIRVNVPQQLVDDYQAGRLSDAGIKTQVLSLSLRDPQSIGLEKPLRPADLGFEDEGPPRASGPFNAAMISAGKEVTRLGSNIKEVLIRDPEVRATEQGRQAEMQRITEPVREEFPKSSFGGEILPGFAVPGGRVAQAVAGGVMGALEGDTLGERAANAALGSGLSVVGSFIGEKVGGRVLNRVQQVFRLAKAAPRKILQRAGIRLTPGQSGSGLGRAVDIARSTITGRQPLLSRQIAKLNRLAANVIGENTDELTPDVLGRAAKRIGSVFDSATDRLDDILPLDPSDILPRVNQAAQEVTDPQKLAGPLRIFTKAINDGVDGDRYVSLRSRLTKMSMQLWSQGNGVEAEVVDGMIDTLDDALQIQVPDLASDLAKARAQWRFLAALRRGAALDPEGNININSMNRAIDSKYPNADIGIFPEGDAGDFIEVLKAFNSVVRPFRSSGTTERAAQLAGLGAAATGIATGNPAIAAGPLAVGSLPFLGGGTGSVLGGGAGRAVDPLIEALQQQKRPRIVTGGGF